MNANELALYMEDITDYEESPYRQAATMLRKQAEKIEALKQIIDANNLNQNIGQFVKPDLKIEEIMSKHCTCYKLGYSQLNDYRKVETK
jgi:hypothetical protein